MRPRSSSRQWTVDEIDEMVTDGSDTDMLCASRCR